jgi:hypothetical protein
MSKLQISYYLAGIATATIFGGAAVAISSDEFTYSSTQTGHLSIDPASLSPANEIAAKNFQIANLLLSTKSASRNCYNTGLNFPDGARLINVTVQYHRGGRIPPLVRMYQNGIQTNDGHILLQRTLQYTGGGFAHPTIGLNNGIPSQYKTVDNNASSYGFTFCLSNNDIFKGAKVEYTYISAGD